MATIHFGEKHKQELLEKFAEVSVTDSMFSHEMDTQFSGAATVHVTTIKTEKMQDYDRSKAVSNGSRYGETKEVGTEVQTFTMTQDKSLSLSIDKGNKQDEFNMKSAGKVMDAHRKEQIVPEVDKYRLGKWAKEGGIHKELDALPTTATIAAMIMTMHNDVIDSGDVPDDLQLTIARKWLPTLKLADEWVKLDSLGGKTLPKGTIAEFDGMPVRPVPSKRMPVGVPFMLTYKGAMIAPMKINDFKGHTDPPGLSGDLLEFRLRHDAFVIGARANGVAVACEPGTVTAAPTIEVAGAAATITGTGTVYYTVDGSDPRYSKEAKVYSAAVALNDGDEVRAYAVEDGKFWSAVAAYDYKA